MYLCFVRPLVCLFFQHVLDPLSGGLISASAALVPGLGPNAASPELPFHL